MKKLVLMAAALAAGAMVAPTMASADPGQGTVTRTTVTKTDNGRTTVKKVTHNNRRYDNGRRWHTKTVCTTKWKHGRKIRECRKVRVRR